MTKTMSLLPQNTAGELVRSPREYQGARLGLEPGKLRSSFRGDFLRRD
jgi:hypothetical protein